MRIFFRQIKEVILRLIGVVLYPHLKNSNLIIIRMDGGVCSQMAEYLLGQTVRTKGVIRYDLSWFSSCGKDTDGVHARHFDLLRAFPTLDFPVASPRDVRIFKRFFRFNNTGRGGAFKNVPPPVYFTGYYDSVGVTEENFNRWFSFNENILDGKSEMFYSEIVNQRNAVGVHVRRGDMKKIDSFSVVSQLEYFVRAIELLKDQLCDPVFYFFSDEIDWVVDQILPRLIKSVKTRIVDVNYSDRGYIDLFLLSSCKYQVASRGSFGKYAGVLNKNQNKVVIVNNESAETKWWLDRFPYFKTLPQDGGVSDDQVS